MTAYRRLFSKEYEQLDNLNSRERVRDAFSEVAWAVAQLDDELSDFDFDTGQFHVEYGSVERRVEAGARLLDRMMPSWEELIDLDKLHINSGTDCILGQLFGGFERGLEPLGLPSYRIPGSKYEQAAKHHGFWPAIKLDHTDDGGQLTYAWRVAIVKRLHTRYPEPTPVFDRSCF